MNLIHPNIVRVVDIFEADGLPAIVFDYVDGFDLEVGTTTPNFLESRVNRAMVKAARKVVVVCDSSKFNHRSLSRITPPGAINYLITDRNLPAAAVDALRAHNIHVTLV